MWKPDIHACLIKQNQTKSNKIKNKNSNNGDQTNKQINAADKCNFDKNYQSADNVDVVIIIYIDNNSTKKTTKNGRHATTALYIGSMNFCRMK